MESLETWGQLVAAAVGVDVQTAASRFASAAHQQLGRFEAVRYEAVHCLFIK